jgi:hypothetical protein
LCECRSPSAQRRNSSTVIFFSAVDMGELA